jgi:hypothetical protein
MLASRSRGREVASAVYGLDLTEDRAECDEIGEARGMAA